MEPTTLQTRNAKSIDVTGLDDKAIRVVETLVAQLKGRRPPDQQAGAPHFSSREEWSKALYEWAASHTPLATSADYSRESIYPDRT